MLHIMILIKHTKKNSLPRESLPKCFKNSSVNYYLKQLWEAIFYYICCSWEKTVLEKEKEKGLVENV